MNKPLFVEPKNYSMFDKSVAVLIRCILVCQTSIIYLISTFKHVPKLNYTVQIYQLDKIYATTY